ncbi:MAG: Tex family protein [bacterium]
MQTEIFFRIISEELNLSPAQIQRTVELLDDGNTVPFIARYRKEATGGINEEQIRHIESRIRYLRNLEERKTTVLESIESQGKLTPELKQKIADATKLQEVEDLYLPYRPKKRTRATAAKEKGLEPLAAMMLAQELEDGSLEEAAQPYIDPEKGVNSVEEALAGARDIVAEVISDDADIRQSVRKFTYHTGLLCSKARNEKDVSVYQMYADYHEPVKYIRPHRVLAMNRGEREGFLRVTIEVEVEAALKKITHRYLKNPRSIFVEQVNLAIGDSYQRLIAPAIERELRSQITEKADEHAIHIFAENVKNVLLAPPIHDKVIMGIDPGYRSGCKVAVIDATGKYLEGLTIYPHEPKKRWEFSKTQLKELVARHGVDVFAVGNGTASRETEQLVAEVIHETEQELFYVIVNEAGASVYSASPLAKEEFPDLPAEMRGNISIARRLLDPLSELVKIDPKSIGVGLYQHDVNQNRLGEAIEQVVESAVNYVGVDLNTASKALLKHVAGINSRTAENIVKYREQNGRITSRQQLTEVKGLGEMAFTQSAGFLRITDGDIFFDSTAVHPESYPAVETLLKRFHLTEAEIKSSGSLLRQKVEESHVDMAQLAHECNLGLLTLQDIIDSLEKPNRDPRDEMPKPILRSDVMKMEDLKEGMLLKGTVRNVVDFGAFVDIGVKSDGLLHKSQMSTKFVKNPLDVVSVGDVIDVKVLSVDAERGRIGLGLVMRNKNPK